MVAWPLTQEIEGEEGDVENQLIVYLTASVRG